MTRTENVSDKDAPFQLRGGSVNLMLMKLVDMTSDSFYERLSDKVRQAPNFFRNAPLVLDLDGLSGDENLDFSDIRSRLRACGLMAIGVQGGAPRHQEAALRVGLPALPPGRPARLDTAPTAQPIVAAKVQPPPPQEPPPRTTLFVSEPVRSGRQLYAAGGDLVITNLVSAGAELLADGNIHVYGALRGRALAGISGDTNARILCLSLEAEMVSIAGLYRVNEDIAPSFYRKPVQIYLKEGYLCLDTF
ncbi:MAG: septum site-determining protein MinC [Rhodospirillaceae bacterium]